jgi:hypothetical protein
MRRASLSTILHRTNYLDLDDNAVMSADSYADLLERLFATYEGRHSLAAIEHVTTQCRGELAGQTSPSARFELLERLARQRLDDLPPSHTSR